MTNEEIVEKIKNGYYVTDNMQLLYERNIPQIKQIIKPYAVYENMEDLLQEAYFGLWEAVQHYETSENVKFMTYASWWIKSAVQKYLGKCGSVIRIPNYKRQQIIRYKKIVQKLSQELSREPTDKEIADRMEVSIGLIPELRTQIQSVMSLDTPLTDDDNMTLSETLQADFSIENDVVDKIYDEYTERELWEIVERYTNQKENEIIKDYFINNKSMSMIAKEQDIAIESVRQIKEKGLNRLRIGKAKRELIDKFDIVEASIYRTGFERFRNHGQSSVEYIAIRKIQLQDEYEKHRENIETLINSKKRYV